MSEPADSSDPQSFEFLNKEEAGDRGNHHEYMETDSSGQAAGHQLYPDLTSKEKTTSEELNAEPLPPQHAQEGVIQPQTNDPLHSPPSRPIPSPRSQLPRHHPDPNATQMSGVAGSIATQIPGVTGSSVSQLPSNPNVPQLPTNPDISHLPTNPPMPQPQLPLEFVDPNARQTPFGWVDPNLPPLPHMPSGIDPDVPLLIYPGITTNPNAPQLPATSPAASPGATDSNDSPIPGTTGQFQSCGKAHPPPRPACPPQTQGCSSVDFHPLHQGADALGAFGGADGPPEPETSAKEYTVLIIGKTGNGKSSLGNTLLGGKKFPVGRGMSVTTRETKTESVDVGGKILKVIDTPDFTNLTSDPHEQLQHVLKWKVLTNYKPDVIIQVIRCDVRYTQEEDAIYQQIQGLWGDPSLFKQRLLVAFTVGDCQDEPLEEELKAVNAELKGVLQDAQNRYVQVNNKARGDEKVQQFRTILQHLDRVIKQNKEGGGQELSVLIIGKSGHGKSSVGNLLLGNQHQQHFPVGTGLSAITAQSAFQKITLNGRRFKVIDTPELQLADFLKSQEQIDEWKRMTSPNPVLILLVVRCDVRFMPEDLAVYQRFKRLWNTQSSPKTAIRGLVLAFTFDDRRDYELVEHVRRNHSLAEILRDAGNHSDAILAVNSKKSEDAAQREKMVTALLRSVDKQGADSKWLNQAGATSPITGQAVSYTKRYDSNNPTVDVPHRYYSHDRGSYSCSLL